MMATLDICGVRRIARSFGPTVREEGLLRVPTLPHRPAVCSLFFPFLPLITEIMVATIFVVQLAVPVNAAATAAQRDSPILCLQPFGGKVPDTYFFIEVCGFVATSSKMFG